MRGSGGSEALGEVNARLRDGFEAVVLEAFEDGDILAQPVLHPGPYKREERPEKTAPRVDGKAASRPAARRSESD